MAKDLVPTSKFKDISTIMADPDLRARFTNLVDEAITAKAAIQTQQEIIKSLRELAKDDLGLNPKLFNTAVAAAFSNDYTARRDNLEEQLLMLDKFMGLEAPKNDD